MVRPLPAFCASAGVRLNAAVAAAPRISVRRVIGWRCVIMVPPVEHQA